MADKQKRYIVKPFYFDDNKSFIKICLIFDTFQPKYSVKGDDRILIANHAIKTSDNILRDLQVWFKKRNVPMRLWTISSPVFTDISLYGELVGDIEVYEAN